MEKAENFYWKLFKSTFIISAFTVGGGFVIIPLLKAKYVDEYKWIKEKDALDLVAIAQSMPGVVAINSAVILGYKMRGVKGTLTALLATVLPPLITLSLICIFYNLFATNPYVKLLLKGMQFKWLKTSCCSINLFCWYEFYIFSFVQYRKNANKCSRY